MVQEQNLEELFSIMVGDQPHRCDSSSDTDQASAAKVALEIWTFLHSSQLWAQANEQVSSCTGLGQRSTKL